MVREALVGVIWHHVRDCAANSVLARIACENHLFVWVVVYEKVG